MEAIIQSSIPDALERLINNSTIFLPFEHLEIIDTLWCLLGFRQIP